MLSSLIMLGVMVLAFCVAGLALAAFVVKVVISLLLLPFRLIGWLILLPILLLKGVFAVLTGLLIGPVFAILAVVAVAALVAAVVVPLLPLLAVAVLVWLVVRAGSRPAAV